MSQEKALRRASAGTGKTIDFSGIWINQIKSEARIKQVNGVLSGEYESADSSTGGKTIGDLTGYVDGDLVSWVVHWRDFQAITAWVGQLEPTAPGELKTLWQMTKQVDAGDEWASINAGADVFFRKP
ncbi:avidin/streptavidin family protein [Pseudomonas sp. MWU12-2029]|jgi:hypothetical protein|uniref:avidin/streptavidin family protein n=1 Tax=Pseudomonas sp. MWU12-2029 TaxID=2927805 RepID=UPI00200CE215|nr:avidin/streptavidin family protein [Pseudomonas sp. MWU12-2029]